MNSLLHVQDLGVRAYEPVLELQETIVERIRERQTTDTLLLVEHEPVYTLGRNATEANVLISEEELATRGIHLIRTSRGGEVTYHGPGQLVGYPILDLTGRAEGPAGYVSLLEQVLIEVLAHYGIQACTDRRNRGVWVGREKIAAIGVRITRRITMHGFALNVTTDLHPYEGIVPCGIQDRGVTSMDRLVPEISMADVKQQVIKTFCRVFDYEQAKTKTAEAGLA